MDAAGREERIREIDRLVNSPLLHGSESLCNLLRFLARHSLENPGAAPKEYQIATEVFGRPGAFDPRLDSTVRVQTSRLRSKLAEYYAGAGASDPIQVEIPKGSYSVLFQHRAVNNGSARTAPPPEPRRPGLPKWFLLAAALAFAALAYPVVQYWSASSSASRSKSVHRFWGAFLDSGETPLVVFSNAEFVGRPETGMRYFNPATDQRDSILDHYTGVGEVMAIHELDTLFRGLRHSIRVKRGRLITWDEARNSDLIFIGSPSENLSLRELPATQSFQFKVMDMPPRRGDLAVVNVNPRHGELPVYYTSGAVAITEDYAVVGLLPGLDPSRRLLVLAGITTLGTQAAVEYVCRAEKLDELLARLGGSAGQPGPFEALLRVKVSGGVPVSTQLVALRPR